MVHTLVSGYQNGAALNGFALRLCERQRMTESVKPLVFSFVSSIIIDERIAMCIDLYSLLLLVLLDKELSAVGAQPNSKTAEEFSISPARSEWTTIRLHPLIVLELLSKSQTSVYLAGFGGLESASADRGSSPSRATTTWLFRGPGSPPIYSVAPGEGAKGSRVALSDHSPRHGIIRTPTGFFGPVPSPRGELRFFDTTIVA